MPTTWTADELRHFDVAPELQIATLRTDETLRPWVTIWVVRVDTQVYVRTWHRRDTGWFGHALRVPRARVRVPGLEVDVTVVDVGVGPSDVRARVDAAFLTKYGSGGTGRMVSDTAAAATLRFDPRDDDGSTVTR